MLNIVLYQPEIPPNTGNIIRLCANIGAKLHLIEPLGFQLDDKHLKRAGLDYILSYPIQRYSTFEDFLKTHHQNNQKLNLTTDLNINSNIYLCSTKAKTIYSKVHYQANDTFIFGPETRGLPKEILEKFEEQQKIRIPMVLNSRSINLSNAVAIVVYEAWRQLDFGNAS